MSGLARGARLRGILGRGLPFGRGLPGRRHGRRWRRLARALIASALLVPFGAAVAFAHPLGNFTINHHAGIRVEPDRVLLDVVIDQAEIPTFQAALLLDADGDGEFSEDELAVAREDGCRAVGEALTLRVAGAAAGLRLIEAGLTFPPGNGGLSTMRLVCAYEAPLATPIGPGTPIELRDDFEPTRLGWREMTVVGDRVTIDAPGIPATSGTRRLTEYPGGLTGAPGVRSVSFTASPGGAALPAFDVPDADPIGPIEMGGEPAASPATSPGASPVRSPLPSLLPSPSPSGAASASSAPSPPGGGAGATTSASSGTGAVPGGDGAIPDILRSSPVTPAIALVALVTAALLGAGHAVTPGHGKTLMAAYLVGRRGTPRHALGLGLAVSVSHTLGILALALVVVAAERALPADLVVRVAPLVAAVTILAIGGWMLVTEARRGLAARALAAGSDAHAHDEGHDHPHDHAHEAGHDHPHDHANDHAHCHAHDDSPEHAHAGVRHRHLPPAGATITWRSLFVLGLAGGLIPSTNALLILLATIASGRPAWGVVLVAAFGLGMAAVMAGVGLAFGYARGLLERAPSRTRLARAARLVPLGAAVVVLGVGVVLTGQALAAAPFG